MPNTLTDALNNVEVEEAIVPGTTPKLIIAIDNVLLDKTVSSRIDIVQNNEIILQIVNPTIENRKVIHTFTQQETYQMDQGSEISVQVHGLTKTGVAWKSEILGIQIGNSLTSTMI